MAKSANQKRKLLLLAKLLLERSDDEHPVTREEIDRKSTRLNSSHS